MALECKLFISLVLTYVMCSLVHGELTKYVTDELKSLRTDMADVSNELLTLFESVDTINKTCWSKSMENQLNGRKGLSDRSVSGVSNEAFPRKIVRLFEAFATEKLLNRQLQTRLGTLKMNQNKFEKIFDSEKGLWRHFQARLEELEEKQSPINERFELEQRSIEKLQARLEDLEEKLSNTNERLEFEQRLNKQLQARLRSVVTKIVNFDNVFDSEKRLNQALQIRVEALEKETKDVKKNLNAEKRLNRRLRSSVESLEQNSIEINKNWDAEKQLNQLLQTRVEAFESEKHVEILNRLTDLEDSMTDFKKALISERNIIEQLRNQFGLIFKSSINEGVGGKVVSFTARATSTMDSSLKQTPFGVYREVDMETSTISKHSLTPCKYAPVSGVYNVYFNSLEQTKHVYCDSDTDGGEWVVIMRRQDGSVDFDRTWNEYKNGFGNLTGEFWIGNDLLHHLTKFEPLELRIDLKPWGGRKVFAKFDHFQIGSEIDKYILTVSGYSGTAGDGLLHSYYGHDGMKFTTKDSDNDRYTQNCAKAFTGGWWFNSCGRSRLTGTFGNHAAWTSVIWSNWNGDYRFIEFVEMKLRY